MKAGEACSAANSARAAGLTNKQLAKLYPAGTAATSAIGGPLQIVKWKAGDKVEVRRAPPAA